MIGKLTFVVPVTNPAQLSFAVGGVNKVTGLQVETISVKLAAIGTGA